jgi:1-acyl-sn-glycerol-3-phosphate acyltransferase
VSALTGADKAGGWRGVRPSRAARRAASAADGRAREAAALGDLDTLFPAKPGLARARGVAVLCAFLLVTAIGIPIQAAALGLRASGLRRWIPHAYHRLVCRILGIRIILRGRPARDSGVLFVANHCSWIDIPVLSAAAAVSFVAKQEIASWPFFGLLAKLQRTIFIARDKRGETGRYRDTLRERLRADDSLVLFPEGTSSDGNRVLPFKSALFAVAETGAGAKEHDPRDWTPVIQPVSIAYTGLCGLPLQRSDRPFVTWYGDMELVPHLWDMVRRGPIEAVIVFHPPLAAATADSRKRMATSAQEAVARGVTAAIAGRLDEPLSPPTAAAAQTGAKAGAGAA